MTWFPVKQLIKKIDWCCTFSYNWPMPGLLSASLSLSSSNLRLSEQARCHADSGTQQCQGVAAAPNTILVRPPCQPEREEEEEKKKVKWNLCSLYNLTPHDTSAWSQSCRLRWWRVAETCQGTDAIWCVAFVQNCLTKPPVVTLMPKQQLEQHSLMLFSIQDLESKIC